MLEFKVNLPPPDPDEEEIQVGPVEAESAAEVLARLNRAEWHDRFVQDDVAEEPEPWRPTFSIKQMMIVVTGLCVWLGVLRLLQGFSLGMAAGVTGLVALGSLLFVGNQESLSRNQKLTWWAVLGMYLAASFVSMVSG